MTNIYAPRTDTKRCTFFASLPEFLTDHSIIAGDFNCIADPRLDELGGNPHARNYANEVITQISKDYALIDIWRELNKTKRAYTWTGKNPTDGSLISTRIDKILICDTLPPFVLKSYIQPYPLSDHDLVMVTLQFTKSNRGPGLWHFNNTLLDDLIFNEEITNFWTMWITQK